MSGTSSYLAADLNDKRLTNRFNIIVPQLEKGLSHTIPQTSSNKGEMEGVYRFFRNSKVAPDSLISAHVSQLDFTDNSNSLPRFLCLSDSSELDYTGKRVASQLGPLSYLNQRGMILHNSVIIRADGSPLGLLRQDYIIRKDEDFGKSRQRETLPFEQKESVKWLNHFKAAQHLCTQHPMQMVYVADREADIMQVYHARRHKNMHFVIRSQHNRKLHNHPFKLRDLLAKQTIVGTYEARVTHPKTGKVRTAKISVRYCEAQVTLASRSKSKQHLGVQKVNVIEAFEATPCPDIDKPIRWILVTSLPVENFLDAQQIIQYYLLRWLIERFFFLLKSGGANVEQLQLKEPHQLKNAIATYSIAAMNIMKLRYLAQNQPDMKIAEAGINLQACEVLYEYAHKKIDKKILFDKDQPPNMKDFCIVLGRLGGFIPSKRQPLPGMKILTRAYEKLSIILDVYDVYLFQRTD